MRQSSWRGWLLPILWGGGLAARHQLRRQLQGLLLLRSRRWHVIVLNSECSEVGVGGCQAGSPQEQWLQADLAAHPAACTLAYWHRPYYTSGWSLGDAEMHDIWADLYNANADLVLNGHDHDYERFKPQGVNANFDSARGIAEIIVDRRI